MSGNILVGSICLILAILLAVKLLISACDDMVRHSFDRGYACGRAEAEKWWQEQGRQVDQERHKVWREEAEQ